MPSDCRSSLNNRQWPGKAYRAREDDVNYKLRKFWDIGIFGVETTPPYTHREQRAMDMLNKTCRRVGSGYELGLLLNADRVPFPDNYNTVLRRLASVERRLKRGKVSGRLQKSN